MPFIHIKSLPLKVRIKPVLQGLCRDFAKASGIEIKHVHATWEFFLPDHYAVGGKTRDRQVSSSHPILVDLLTPDFNDVDMVGGMLKSIAASLSKRAKIPRTNIFINHRHAHSGMVFDNGQIERW